jgi:LPS export ABC transporter protein LptC
MSTNHQGFVQKISTQFMEIHLNDKKMLSDQRVEIEGAGFTIVSQRFKADLTNLRYELTNDITSIYAPN